MAGTDTIDTGENLGAIFKILQDANTQASADSPYAPAMQILGQTAQATNPLRQNPYTGELVSSPGQAAVSGLVNGIMGGLGQHLQNNYVADQNSQARDILMGAMKGQDVQMPDGMSPSVFNNIKNAASIFSMEKDAQAKMHDQMLHDKALEELFKNPDVAAQYAQTGQLGDLGAVGALKQKRIDAVKSAYPSLSDAQAEASMGDLTKAAAIARENRDMEKPLPDKISAELQNLDNVKARLNSTLPSIQKVEAMAKANPALTIAEIEAKHLLPLSDVAALKSELKSLAFDMMSVKPAGARPPPLSEFEAITQALDGTAPIAQGLTSKRFMSLFNDRASAVQKSIKSSYGIGATKTAAENALKDYSDTFSPIGQDSMPEEMVTIRNKTTGETKQVPKSFFGG